MRRSIIIPTILATGIAVFAACDPKPEVPNKPVAGPSPVQTVHPVSSPTGSPTASPVDPKTSPEVKKAVPATPERDAKPVALPSPKAK